MRSVVRKIQVKLACRGIRFRNGDPAVPKHVSARVVCSEMIIIYENKTTDSSLRKEFCDSTA